MAIQSLSRLKKWFSRGQYPTQEQFADMMDSFVHKEGSVPIGMIDGLTERLNGKYQAESGEALARRCTALELSQVGDHASLADLGVKVSDLKRGINSVAILSFAGFDRPDDPPVFMHETGTFMDVGSGMFVEYEHTTGVITTVKHPSETHNQMLVADGGWKYNPREDCLYRCGNHLYRWNGTRLVRLVDEDDVAEMPREWTAKADEDEYGRHCVSGGSIYGNLNKVRAGDRIVVILTGLGTVYRLTVTGYDPATGIFTSLVVDTGFNGAIVVQFDSDGFIKITKVADADRLESLEERMAELERR